MSFGPEALPPPGDLLWQLTLNRSASSDLASQGHRTPLRGESMSPSNRTPLSRRDTSMSPRPIELSSRGVEFRLKADADQGSQRGADSASSLGEAMSQGAASSVLGDGEE
jgi:hypothetical protein